MRRILWVAGVSLALHTLVFILFDRYRDLTLNLGALFVHGHDISDIPPVMGAGFGVLAIIVIRYVQSEQAFEEADPNWLQNPD